MTASRPLRILVTQGGMRHSVGLVRHLGAAGHRMFALVDLDDAAPPVANSRYCEGIRRAPLNDEIPFIETLIGILSRDQFDVLIPVGFPVTRFVARNLDRLTPLTAVTAPPP